MPEWFKRDVLTPFFGTKKPNGRRRYQELYLEIGSGNAKSTLAICVALYALCADGQNSPRVYCVAGAKDQARIVFEGAKQMVLNNEDLAASIQIFRDTLIFEHEQYGHGFMKVVSADSDKQEGLNPTFVVMDELHVQPNADLHNNLKKNFPKRQEPAMWKLTTAGVNFTFAHEEHNKAVDIRDGKLSAPGYLPVLYCAPLDCDDFDEENWKLANPGWDYLNIDLLRQEAEDAKRSATALASFRRYHLNKWAGVTVTWMTDERWMKGGTAAFAADPEALKQFRNDNLSLEALRGRKCYLAIDLSSSRDTTANIYLFPPVKEGERVKVLKRVFIPFNTLQSRIYDETINYGQWYEDGEIVTTKGDTQDYEAIYHDIEEHAKVFNIETVVYDRWNADEIVQKLTKLGLECKPYRQDFADMNMPMRKLDTMIDKGEIEHGGDPVLRWQCSNVEAKMRTIGGSDYMMPTKSSEKARIDAMVALFMAIGIWIWKTQEAEEVEKSLIKTKGVYKIQLRR